MRFFIQPCRNQKTFFAHLIVIRMLQTTLTKSHVLRFMQPLIMLIVDKTFGQRNNRMKRMVVIIYQESLRSNSIRFIVEIYLRDALHKTFTSRMRQTRKFKILRCVSALFLSSKWMLHDMQRHPFQRQVYPLLHWSLLSNTKLINTTMTR